MSDELIVQNSKNVSIDGDLSPDVKIQSKLEQQSDSLIQELFNIDLRDLQEQQKRISAISGLGSGVQKELSRQSTLLKQPLSKLVNDAEDGGLVGNSLIALQEKTDKINPNKIDFSMGALRRILSKIPGFGSPMSRWFAQFQSVDSVINEIVKNLEDGKGELERDNTTLKDDQITMRSLIFKMQDYISYGMLLENKIETKLKGDVDSSRRQFIEEEILFSLRQRILDLQQQLAVNQQGILTSEIIIKNNKELIRGVARSLNVTITALNIAASLAVALQTQKTILKSVQSVNENTNNLISETAKNLKNQGAKIHKEAVGAQLNIDTLKEAFTDVGIALTEISSFRRDALPEMSRSIAEMEQLTTDMNNSIQKLDQSETVQCEILI
jgi:uncharacterized protein YaaN involved in tellurite resistance